MYLNPWTVWTITYNLVLKRLHNLYFPIDMKKSHIDLLELLIVKNFKKVIKYLDTYNLHLQWSVLLHFLHMMHDC